MVFGLGVPIGAANMEYLGDLLLITLIYATFISVSLIHIIAGVRGGRSLIDAPTVPMPIAFKGTKSLIANMRMPMVTEPMPYLTHNKVTVSKRDKASFLTANSKPQIRTKKTINR